MFDVGFWEMAFIGVIALVVIGPERLPGVARTVGLWVGKGRRMLNEVMSDVKKEMKEYDIEQVKNLRDDMKSVGDKVKKSMTEVADSADDSLGQENNETTDNKTTASETTTDKKVTTQKSVTNKQTPFDWHAADLSLTTQLNENFQLTQNVRRFLTGQLDGKQLPLGTEFHAWVHEEKPATLAEVVNYLSLNYPSS